MSPLRVHVLEFSELEQCVRVRFGVLGVTERVGGFSRVVVSARVIACIVTGASEFVRVLRVIRRGHVTLLARVGDMARVGDGCGGERVGIGVGERGGGLISPLVVHVGELARLVVIVFGVLGLLFEFVFEFPGFSRVVAILELIGYEVLGVVSVSLCFVVRLLVCTPFVLLLELSVLVCLLSSFCLFVYLLSGFVFGSFVTRCGHLVIVDVGFGWGAVIGFTGVRVRVVLVPVVAVAVVTVVDVLV